MSRVHQVVVVPITGQDFYSACGLCDIPPWEHCACSFPARSATDRANTEADESMQLVLVWDEL